MRLVALIAIAAGLLVPLVAPAPAHAQATRTYVSGVGDDVNPCSRTAPCKTFAGAISKTATGGIINCLDNAGYGTLTIVKSITVDCSPYLGGVLASGTNGIIVNGAGITVVLRGLDIEGASASLPGSVGISIIAASAVHIQKSFIYGFQSNTATGVRIATTSGNPKVMISDTYIHDNGVLGTSTGGGIISVGTGGFPFVTLDNVKVNNNAQGVANGVNGRMRITNSLFSGNFAAVGADPGAQVSLNNSDINFSQTAVVGTVTSFGNNRIIGNTSDGTPLVAAGSPSSDLGQR